MMVWHKLIAASAMLVLLAVPTLGQQPLDLQMQAFYNVEKPAPAIAQGPNLENQCETWTRRLQLELLFPK